MPTPFTHLAAAAELLAAPDLASDARAALQADWPAFLFGNTAPDVQTISGQPRDATHFFSVPLRGAPAAGPRLLAHYPALAARAALPPPQAAFIAGYLAHLVFDQLWVRDLFEPYFGEAQAWGTFHERLYLHNVLRAHVDADDLARLTPVVGARLQAATPDGWLPFVDSHHLRAWRDLIVISSAAAPAARWKCLPNAIVSIRGNLQLCWPRPHRWRRVFFRICRQARWRLTGLGRWPPAPRPFPFTGRLGRSRLSYNRGHNPR